MNWPLYASGRIVTVEPTPEGAASFAIIVELTTDDGAVSWRRWDYANILGDDCNTFLRQPQASGPRPFRVAGLVDAADDEAQYFAMRFAALNDAEIQRRIAARAA